jgi:uncharacterized C2H2 Zn-finger protein
MIPQIKVKLRQRNGIKYTIEYFSGKQFRCYHCGDIFLTEKEIIKHLDSKSSQYTEKKKNKIPKLYDNTSVNLLYTEDIKDELKQKYFEKIKTKSK